MAVAALALLAACTSSPTPPSDSGAPVGDAGGRIDAGTLPVGAWRDLGEFPCAPGRPAYAGCSAACGIGTCTGDPVLRICTAGTAAECERGSAAHTDTDDACDSLCPATRVECPASGRVRLLAQSAGPRSPAVCAAAVRSEGAPGDAGADAGAGACATGERAGTCAACTVESNGNRCGWCADDRRCLEASADGTRSADGTCSGAGWVRPGAETCPLECPAGQSICRGACIDLQTSRTDCGTCGHACGPAAGCLDGACVSYGPFLGVSGEAMVRAGSGEIWVASPYGSGVFQAGLADDRASRDIVEALPLGPVLLLTRTRSGRIAAYPRSRGSFVAPAGVLGDVPDAVRVGVVYSDESAPTVYVVQSDGTVRTYDGVYAGGGASFTLRSTTRIPSLRSFTAGLMRSGAGWAFAACAILTDSTVSCGPLTASGPQLTPLPIADAVDVSIWLGSACVVRGDGTVWCWGGITGNRAAGEPEAGRDAPVRVDGITTARWVSVRGGDALVPPGLGIVGLADGTLVTFGNRTAVTVSALGPWPSAPWTARAPTLIRAVRSGVCGSTGCTLLGPDDQFVSFNWLPASAPACLPQCGERTCGPTGCPDGSNCGECGSGQTCSDAGRCVACSCAGRACGDDGCGRSCGTCPASGAIAGVCRNDHMCCAPTFNCGSGRCGPNGCGENCGCPAGRVCNAAGVCECVPGCAGAMCGTDACGRSCGACAGRCVLGQCCIPNCAGRTCGEDGCGGSCGVCPAGRICARGPGGMVRTCVVPSGRGPCTGADVCQGCAPCSGGLCAYPTATDSCSCTPNCAGRTCGDNGCGGFCGSGCPSGQSCLGGSCVRAGGVCTLQTGCVDVAVRHPTSAGSCPGEITATMTNRCGRPVYCQYRVDDGGGAGGIGIATGATVGGELGGIWSCGHAPSANYVYRCAAAEEAITCSNL